MRHSAAAVYAALDQHLPLRCQSVAEGLFQARAGFDRGALLEAIARAEWTLAGFRNRDIRSHLFKATPKNPRRLRRQSAAIGRRLRLLRAPESFAKSRALTVIRSLLMGATW
jgi:hypothetical protein